MSKIKIGAQVTAKVRHTNVTVSGTFQGYELEDPEDPTSGCGKVLYVKDGMMHLDRVYIDSIKVFESEDERIIGDIKKAVELYWSDEPLDEILSWLEKQKEQQPAEWSEEDENWSKYLLDELYAGLEDYCGAAEKDMKEAIKWFKTRLKSLRTQHHWKPSKEQMTNLINVRNYVAQASGHWGESLSSLIDDLQKL